MTNILFLIETIYCNTFRCNYLRNNKIFSQFFVAFSKSERQHFHHIYSSLWRQFSWEKFLLVICKVLGLFVNTLTADGQYSLLNRDNLLQLLQIQLSHKQKTFSQFFFFFFFFFTFFKSRFNFVNLKKKITLIADLFLKLQTPKNVLR